MKISLSLNVNGQDMEFEEAIIRGSSVRLRPILMTTSAMVLGSLPLALATGPGSIGRAEIEGMFQELLET